MNYRRVLLVLVLISAYFQGVYAVQITGQLKKWHKVTLTFDGPHTSETATPNPFLDYRLNVLFTHPQSGTSYNVCGYYAADGNAANTGRGSGRKWRVHFSPDQVGNWKYEVSFDTGKNIAAADSSTDGKSAGYFDNTKGTFNILPSDKSAPDFRAKGRLRYVGKRYLQFADTKEYFLKQGTDAPENLLAYADFDGNFKTDGKKDKLIKTWKQHTRDWRTGDPIWQGEKGKGLIGAINYLHSEGLNVFSFLTMNIAGDDRNVFPYTDYDERLRFDVSRLDQWEIVFSHADTLGMFLHFKTQETENDQLLDGGELGIQRKLYYRELIARFGHHLALNWNLGEENTNTTAQQKQFCEFFKKNDPYNHLIVLHTYPNKKQQVYSPLLGNASLLTGLSLQTNQRDFSNVHKEVDQWVKKSAAAGKPWAVACDEPGDATLALVPDSVNPSHDNARINALWGTLMAGGWGCEWYFGYKNPHSDLTCQDFRSRDKFWDQCRYALEFFDKQKIPFWQMECDDELTPQKNDYCFYKDGSVYLIYLKQGGGVDLEFTNGTFEYGWFNPRTGKGAEKLLHQNKITGPTRKTITIDDKKDWLLTIKSKNGGKIKAARKPRN